MALKPAQEHEGSDFLRHVPCPACGSKDNNAEYTDGHTYCFGCGAHVNSAGSESAPRQLPVEGLIHDGEAKGLLTRKITAETCERFGYQKGDYNGRPVQIAPYYDASGRLVAQKLRFPDKTFFFLGESKRALPFGSHVWQKQGKKIVVTEGEIDALSMSQVQGNKYPTVSIGCGAGPQIKKYFAKHREYFSGFDQVVLMFDMDDPGKQAAIDAASVLGSRARIAHLPLKDANEMLRAGKTAELIDAMWKATEYRPEGIVDMADLKAKVMERPQAGLSWPFPALTEMTYGIRLGEILALGAGTGVGKTDLLTQTMKHLIVEHKVPIGVFALEQVPVETATRLAGKLVNKTFHIPDSGWSTEDLESAWSQLMSSGKVFLYDSFGQNDWQIIKEKMEYLYHAHDVRYFFLDHLTALAAWQDDERKELELIMSEMGSLVKRLGVTIFLISHLSTPEGKSHEEGGRVTIKNFKGSRAIGFWCHYMFGLERDQQADNIRVRKTTTLRCLKDRYTGRATGEVFYLGYDPENGLLFETKDPTGPAAGSDYGLKDETKDDEEEGDF